MLSRQGGPLAVVVSSALVRDWAQRALTSLGEARRSVRAMRPRSLLGGSLNSALDDLLKRMTSGTPLQAEIFVD